MSAETFELAPQPVQRRFSVTGRVQGVFFRDSTRQQALRLQLSGYARNLADGSVEVVGCGDADALDELAAWLQTGPRLARVDGVIELPVKAGSYDDFTTG